MRWGGIRDELPRRPLLPARLRGRGQEAWSLQARLAGCCRLRVRVLQLRRVLGCIGAGDGAGEYSLLQGRGVEVRRISGHRRGAPPPPKRSGGAVTSVLPDRRDAAGSALWL